MRPSIILLPLLLISFSAFAQINHLRFQGGAGAGWISGNSYSSENQTVRSAPVIGVEFAFFMGEHGLFSVGADFMKKGAWDLGIRYQENNVTYTTNSYTSDYKYAVLPFIYSYTIGSENAMLTLGGGAFLGVLFQHQHEVNTGVLNIRVTENDTENYNLFDAGLQLRISLLARISDKNGFILSVNYQKGFLNTTNLNLTDGGGLNTNALFVQTGFSFTL